MRKVELTSIHSISSKQLMTVANAVLNVEPPICQGIDGICRLQISPVSVQSQMMVLIVVTNAFNGLDNWDASTFQDLWLTDTRSLQDQRSGVGASGENHELAGLDGARRLLGGHVFWVWKELRVGLVLHACGLLVAVEKDTDDLLLAKDVQVRIIASLDLGVDEAVGSILAPPVAANVLEPSFGGVVGIEIL